MLYEFKYTLDDNDYYEFIKYYCYNIKFNKKSILSLQLFVPFYLALFLLILLYLRKVDILYGIIICVILSIAWVFSVKPYFYRSLKRDIENTKKNGRFSNSKERLVQFYEDYLFDITIYSEIKINYTIIEKIAAGKSAIYIHIDPNNVYVIPFSVFESKDQKKEFLEFINKKVELKKENYFGEL